MKFQDQSNIPQVEFDFAPMIDVVFLLLIFFIVTWNFARMERDLDVAVPAAEEGADPEQAVGEIIVNVRNDGIIIVNGVQVSEEDLLNRFQAIAKEYPDQAVILRGDQEAAFKYIIDVLDVCKKANIWNVAFATTRPEEAETP